MTEAGAQQDFKFALQPASDALRPYCHTLYTVECGAEGIEDIIPAYSPQLLIFAEGQAEMRFADGRVDFSERVSIVSQVEEAAHYKLHGPARLIGASLSIPGWLALGGPSMATAANRMRPVGEVLGPKIAERLEAIRRQLGETHAKADEVAHELSRTLEEAADPISRDQQQFIDTVIGWLESRFDPKLSELHAALPMSPRHIQRLSRRYFGRAPSALAKRRRAVRAASLLASPTPAPELESEIFDAYFDQAHLIREIRKYTGRTPKRLEIEEASPGVDCLVNLDRTNDELFDRIAGDRHSEGEAA